MADDDATYQQMRLLEEVSNARREGRPYLVAQVEAIDAQACVARGLLSVEGGVATLTEAGSLYIIDLNKSTPA